MCVYQMLQDILETFAEDESVQSLREDLNLAERDILAPASGMVASREELQKSHPVLFIEAR